VAGYVMGFVFGGLIHLLLPIAIMAFFVQHRLKAKVARRSEVSPAGILSIVLRRSREVGADGAPSRAGANQRLLSSQRERSPSARTHA
jgi:hypothetical protein